MAEVQDNLSTSRKTASVAILVTLAFLSGYATSLLLNQIIPAGVNVTVRSDEGFLRAYWDPARTQLVNSIDFGDVRQGDSSSVNLYIFNENATSATMAGWSSNIVEATNGSITDLLTVDGADLRGMEIAANSYAYATYTIHVSLAASPRRYDWTLNIETGLPTPAEYSFQFSATDAVFDPARPYLYVSDKYARKVHFVNLMTGSIEQTFDFSLMPESLAITPDGSSLFVTLLTREHSPYWFDEEGHLGYVSVFDLNARAREREFRINEDPFDMVLTRNGHLVVSSGSGQWTYIRVYDAQTGDELGAAYSIRHMSRLALHPSEAMVYAADTDLSPSDITRYNLSQQGAITRAWDSPYHGDHRMDGNVWASPRGDILVTRGGDVFTVGTTRDMDMIYVTSLAAQTINEISFDVPFSVIFTGEGFSLRYYNIETYFNIGSQTGPQPIRFVNVQDDVVKLLLGGDDRTVVLLLPHPVLGGASNTPPSAFFTMTPRTSGTTLTNFVLDASSSSDTEDPPSTLRFRWDLNGDGVWETTFSSDPIILKRYDTAGTRNVRLQVRDTLGLVDDFTRKVHVTFEPDPGEPGPQHPVYELPYGVTDAIFDPIRPYLYVSDKSARRVYFINLATGLTEKQFEFTNMPESLAIAPDASVLFVALLTREHSPYWWDGDHVGQIAGFNLSTRVKDRQFEISEDPSDILATSNGQLVVSSGSGQWTYIRVFNAQTGDELGAAYPIRHMSRLALHPSEAIVYSADTDVSPSDISRWTLQPSGAIAYAWDSRYHGEHRMGGNVWASPRGDVLVTRGGDVFTAGSARENDMVYVASMAPQTISDLAFDLSRNIIFSAEGMAIRYYDITNYELRGSITFEASVDFVGTDGLSVFAMDVQTSRTYILVRDHPFQVAKVD